MNTLSSRSENYAVVLYDMGIKDISERVKNRIEFPKAIAAANFLGIEPKQFYQRIGIGRYAYHAVTGKQYAIRKLK